MRHYGVNPSEVDGWLWIRAPGAKAGKLLTVNRKGRPESGTMAAIIERAIVRRKVDIVSLDPFVKTHRRLRERQQSHRPGHSDPPRPLRQIRHRRRHPASRPQRAVRSGQRRPRPRGEFPEGRLPPRLYAFDHELGGSRDVWNPRGGAPQLRPDGQGQGQHRSASAKGAMVQNRRRPPRESRPNSIPTAMRSKPSNRGRRRQHSTGSTPGLAIAFLTRSTRAFRTASGTVQRRAPRLARHGWRSKDTRQGSPNLNAGKSSGSGSQTAF